MANIPRYCFTFGGRDLSKDFGIWIEQVEDYLQPALRERKQIIPDRDGAYDYGAKYYDERILILNCASLKNISREEHRELSYVLSQKKRIVIYNEPGKYYYGRIYDPAEIVRAGIIGRRYVLTFVCDPFAYGETVQSNIPNVITPINYGGTARTPTRMEITNTDSRNATNVTIRLRIRRA